MSEKVFRIKIPVSQIKRLQNDEKFILILRLSRFINQLSFCHEAYLGVGKEITPTNTRHLHNSFLFSCAVLYEALKFYPKLGKEFLSFASHKNGFAKLSKHPDFDFVKNQVLNKMRNEFIFHVDEGPFINALKQYGDRSVDFLISKSNQHGDIYYSLADELSINYVIGEHDTDEIASQYYQEMVKKISNIMVEFIHNANKLIQEYVNRKLWKVDEKILT
jgi:hypothetical protein